MDAKDIVTLSLSGAAFLLSLSATVISLRQKKFESERTLRQQLTDAIGKLNTTFESAQKLEQEKADTLNEPAVANLRAFYNGQKVFYARQAMYVADQIPKLVADAEYNSIARAFIDVDDDDHALLYYRKAIDAASGPLYRATNLRGYGRTLMRIGRTTEGRDAFAEAVALVPGSTDSALFFRAETCQRWAASEFALREYERASKLLATASATYADIQFVPRRLSGLRMLAELQKALQKSAATLDSPSTPPPAPVPAGAAPPNAA